MMILFFVFFWSIETDCARDEVIFNDAGKAFNYQCDNGGNYQKLQTIGNLAFCVDADGFITSDLRN